MKLNFGKYLDAASNNNGNYTITNPTSRMAGSTEAGRPAITRTWNDSFYPVGDPRRGNYVPDCDLLLPDGNAECGPLSDRNFGTAKLSNNFDPAVLEGWGVRPADWEFGASVQQEILPRVSLEVGYFRRWLQNFYVNDNLATAPSDFTLLQRDGAAGPATARGRRQHDRGTLRRRPHEVRADRQLLHRCGTIRRVLSAVQRVPPEPHRAARRTA